MSLVSPIHELLNGLDRLQTSLGSALFLISKMNSSLNQINQAVQLCLTNLNSLKLAGGSILNSSEILKRMSKESDWKNGLILVIEEIEGGMPYIEHTVRELQQNARVTQNYAEVSERISKPLRKSIISAEANEQWNKIDAIQLQAFNTSMAKLMTLMVSTNNAAKELFEDMKSLIDMMKGMHDYLMKAKRPANSSQIIKAERFLQMLSDASQKLIDEVAQTSQIFISTKVSPLLHPQTLRLPLTFSSGGLSSNTSVSALAKLNKLIIERRQRASQTRGGAGNGNHFNSF